ncbi:hypothetical protein I5R65_00480 [Herbaspirillum sp. AP02]|uniref:hypothetical protein n=1 Tax=unclassified Herbaspirillum TaxID=2624150 RepID=UPI0018CA7393|nr:hypothetical protein [Herbaspirillum sp. AP02]MBG7617927.1 hypothetical protein [Herbaspirillum sp. AP02]
MNTKNFALLILASSFDGPPNAVDLGVGEKEADLSSMHPASLMHDGTTYPSRLTGTSDFLFWLANMELKSVLRGTFA